MAGSRPSNTTAPGTTLAPPSGWTPSTNATIRGGFRGLPFRDEMAEFKGIPVVPETARSGQKYRTAHGVVAIKDGIKAGAIGVAAPAARKPPWLRAPMPAGVRFDEVRHTVREHRLATVCEEAKCPNIGECWNAGTATLMLMGEVCARACRFCAVDTGNPHGWLDTEEPANAARTVEPLGLPYVGLPSLPPDHPPDRHPAPLA